jgi:hypothetical protein
VKSTSRVCLWVPMAASQSRTVLSYEADATVVPSGEKATDMTESLWPLRVCLWAPMAASQSRTVLSFEADATVVPSGEKATDMTDSLWPSRVCLWAPVAASQSRTVLSSEADATVVPSGEKATDMTESLWPSRVCWWAPHWSLILFASMISGSLSFHYSLLTMLIIGLNTSAEPYICSGARSIIDPWLRINFSASFKSLVSWRPLSGSI